MSEKVTKQYRVLLAALAAASVTHVGTADELLIHSWLKQGEAAVDGVSLRLQRRRLEKQTIEAYKWIMEERKNGTA